MFLNDFLNLKASSSFSYDLKNEFILFVVYRFRNRLYFNNFINDLNCLSGICRWQLKHRLRLRKNMKS